MEDAVCDDHRRGGDGAGGQPGMGKIGRTEAIMPTDHILYTADNRYAFMVYWEPETMRMLDVARAADVKAVMAAAPPGG